MLGIIGGSGLDCFTELQVQEQSYSETPWGKPSAALQIGTLRGVKLVFLPRHGERHQVPPHRVNYRANIAAFREQGVTQVIAVNAVGAIAPALQVGDLVTPDQLIDYTWGRAHSFFDGQSENLEHIDFTYPFHPELKQRLLRCAEKTGTFVYPKATCAVTQGPRLETAAEIRKMAKDGCDIVGMTNMPEAALAREAGLAYVSLALVVNSAAGIDGALVTLDEINQVIHNRMPVVRQLLMDFLRPL